jgi:uncharacterized protein YbaA (DUF1428 family)
MFAESGHVDAIFCQAEDLEAGQVKAKKKAIKPQDLHEILDVVLESYIKIQDRERKSDVIWYSHISLTFQR